MKVTTIGLDLAKNVFQVHGVSDQGSVILVKRLRRRQMIGFFSKLQSCLIGMEACATAITGRAHWRRSGMRSS